MVAGVRHLIDASEIELPVSRNNGGKLLYMAGHFITAFKPGNWQAN